MLCIPPAPFSLAEDKLCTVSPRRSPWFAG